MLSRSSYLRCASTACVVLLIVESHFYCLRRASDSWIALLLLASHFCCLRRTSDSWIALLLLESYFYCLRRTSTACVALLSLDRRPYYIIISKIIMTTDELRRAPLLLASCSSTACVVLLYCLRRAPLLLASCSSTACVVLLYCLRRAPLLLASCSSTACVVLLYCLRRASSIWIVPVHWATPDYYIIILEIIIVTDGVASHFYYSNCISTCDAVTTWVVLLLLELYLYWSSRTSTACELYLYWSSRTSTACVVSLLVKPHFYCLNCISATWVVRPSLELYLYCLNHTSIDRSRLDYYIILEIIYHYYHASVVIEFRRKPFFFAGQLGYYIITPK
jgi:hypothetical protein